MYKKKIIHILEINRLGLAWSLVIRRDVFDDPKAVPPTPQRTFSKEYIFFNKLVSQRTI